MGKITIVSYSNVKLSSYGLFVVEPPKLSFECVLVLDNKMEKSVGNDIVSQQEFKDQANKIYEQTKKKIEDKMLTFDTLFWGMCERGTDEKTMKKLLKGLNDALKKDMEVAEKAAALSIMKFWKNFQKKKKELRDFQCNIIVSAVTTLVNFGISIAAMATTPFTGGLSSVLAIKGLLNNIVKLSEIINTITTDTGKAITSLKTEVKNVQSTVKKDKLDFKREVSAAAMNALIGKSISSIKTVEKAAKVVKGKYAGLVDKMHDLSKEVKLTIDANAQLKRDFRADAEKRLKNYPIVDKAKELKKVEKQLDLALKDTEAVINSQLNSIIKQYKDLKVHAAEIDPLFKKCTALKSKDTATNKAFREFIGLMNLFSEIGQTLNDTSSAATTRIGKVNAALAGYSYKKISSIALKDTIWHSGIVA